VTDRDDAMRSMDDAHAIAREFDGVLGFLVLDDNPDELATVIVRVLSHGDRVVLIVNDVGSLEELSRVIVPRFEWTKLISDDEDESTQ
jgi:hypothetical protein